MLERRAAGGDLGGSLSACEHSHMHYSDATRLMLTGHALLLAAVYVFGVGLVLIVLRILNNRVERVKSVCCISSGITGRQCMQS